MTRDASEARYPWLPDAVNGGAEIVTANRRLARDLATNYGEQQIAAGSKAWLTPPILFWQDWLARKLSSAQDPAMVPRRLDPFSANVLWELCLRKRMPDGLLSFGGIVRQSGQAWQRLGDWRVPMPALLASVRTRDERLFAAAAADYQDRLDTNNWVDNPGLAAAVEALIRSDDSIVPSELILAGFDQLTPAVEQVIGALAEAGCRISVRPASENQAAISMATFDQESAELRAAGAWAREKLESMPEARVAVVIPALEANAADIGRLVREGLAPGWQLGSTRHRAAVNVSYGRRLSDYPAISTALLLLRWTVRGLAGRELSILLRSRCIGSESLGERARLEHALRAQPDREWTAANFIAVLGSPDDSAGQPSFVDIARSVRDFSADAERRKTPLECVKAIDALLQAVGWPGDSPLDSAGFQLNNRWRELLNDFARVVAVLPTLSLTDAIPRISSLAAETIWQPEAETAIVEVMGFLEAAGMEFDYLWICGMDAAQWPPPARPTPFLSPVLQRDRGMPDATPGATLEFSQKVLDRLTRSAGECVVSWSRTRDDTELTVSALLDTIEATQYDGPGDPGWSAQSMMGTAAFEEIAGDPAPPVDAQEQVGGGAYTVQQQFSEPFSAFVHGRLRVRLLDQFWTGLSPGIRGNIIHNALHNLLAERPSQQELVAWSPAERGRRIGSAVDAALAPHIRDADEVIRRIIGLERGRLLQLLSDFIDAETGREPFSVMDVEKKIQFEACGVRLGFRVDRIDQADDGRLLVIDYKTGQPKTFVKQSGELKDVQLVVYAAALDADIGGLVFINVDSRAVVYRAAGSAWNGADDDTWPDTLRAWQAEVHAAIEALARGDVRLNIRQSGSASRPLAILSRIEEQKRVD